MAAAHRLAADQVHYEWNNALEPRLEIEPGDTVDFDTRDAADGYYSKKSTHADVLGRGPFRGHPLTGPVRVRGAAPGDTLIVEVLDMEPAADFGWTAIRPGRGLLPEAEFPSPPPDLGRLGPRLRAHGARHRRSPRLLPRGDGDGARRAGRAQHDAAPEERRQHGHQAPHGGLHALPARVGRRRPVQHRRRPRRPGRRRGVRHRGRDGGPRDAALLAPARPADPRAPPAHGRHRPADRRAVLRDDRARPRPLRLRPAGHPAT